MFRGFVTLVTPVRLAYTSRSIFITYVFYSLRYEMSIQTFWQEFPFKLSTLSQSSYPFIPRRNPAGMLTSLSVVSSCMMMKRSSFSSSASVMITATAPASCAFTTWKQERVRFPGLTNLKIARKISVPCWQTSILHDPREQFDPRCRLRWRMTRIRKRGPKALTWSHYRYCSAVKSLDYFHFKP